MSGRALPDLLACCLLAAARCLPLFWLTPALAFGVTPGLLGAALALGMACTLAPLLLLGMQLPAAGDALWLAAALELVRGAVIALGLALPALALRVSGAIAQGLFSLEPSAASGSKLGRLTGFAALAVAVSADGLSGALGLLLSDLAALPASFDAAALRALLLPLAELVLHAFTIGVGLSGALLLGSVLGALILGILGRIASASRPQAIGPALWPGVGLGLLSLVVARWLAEVPELARGFAQGTARLLSGLP